jgi:hypothetical protein
MHGNELRGQEKKKAIDGAGIDGLADRRLGQTTGGCGLVWIMIRQLALQCNYFFPSVF